MLRRSIIIARSPSTGGSKPDSSPDYGWRISMKTMILAAVAAMSLGVGAAYAAGGPVGWEPQSYGTQATSNQQNEPVVQFLGKGTVVGKMLNYNSNYNGVSGATSSNQRRLVRL
jgi:hypothetical protein